MKKIFTLSTCNTSKRILDESGILDLKMELQDIKKMPVSKEDLEELKTLAGSYEALFSKRAQKYKALGLKNMNLNEADYKSYLLQDYTFLKRPVIVDGNYISVGNSPKVQNQLKDYVNAKITE